MSASASAGAVQRRDSIRNGAENDGPFSTCYCPLGHELMLDPVRIIGCGHTFERGQIQQWYARCLRDGRVRHCPLCQRETDGSLTEDLAVAQLLQVKRHIEQSAGLRAPQANLLCGDNVQAQTLQALRQLQEKVDSLTAKTDRLENMLVQAETRDRVRAKQVENLSSMSFGTHLGVMFGCTDVNTIKNTGLTHVELLLLRHT